MILISRSTVVIIAVRSLVSVLIWRLSRANRLINTRGLIGICLSRRRESYNYFFFSYHRLLYVPTDNQHYIGFETLAFVGEFGRVVRNRGRNADQHFGCRAVASLAVSHKRIRKRRVHAGAVQHKKTAENQSSTVASQWLHGSNYPSVKYWNKHGCVLYTDRTYYIFIHLSRVPIWMMLTLIFKHNTCGHCTSPMCYRYTHRITFIYYILTCRALERSRSDSIYILMTNRFCMYVWLQ